MVIKCCVYKCDNIYKGRKVEGVENSEQNAIMFHRIPKNVERKAKWIGKIKEVNGFTWEPKNIQHVCSEHFDESSWEPITENHKRKLKSTAIPSVFNENLTSKVMNFHTYSMPLQDISNKNNTAFLSAEKKKLRVSRDNDHTYSSMCSNDGHDGNILEIKDNSVKKTTSKDDESLTSISSKIQQENVTNLSEVDSLFVVNSRNASNNSNIMQCDEEKSACSHTVTQTDALDVLSDWVAEVKNDIGIQTVTEQNIDLKNAILTKENEQLKQHLAELNRTLNKILGQNQVLRNSNKNMHNQLNTLKNIKKKEEENLKTFNLDQKKALCRKNSQGLKWESATLKQALIMKLKCGSSGYEEIGKRFPLPSLRTLQRRTQFIEFKPGILTEVFDFLGNEVYNHKEEWKDCVLALDEMSIISGEVIDPSTKEAIGRVTLTSHEGLANKALVFALGGIMFRWKQIVCYHLTSSKAANVESDATGKTYVEIINTIIECGEKIGLRIHCVISDMGSDNRSMWKIFGIMANRSKVICHLSHPVRPLSQLYIMPDVPHLFKSIKSMLVSNKIIYLPEDVVHTENLPTNEVKIEHILHLLDTEAPLELKVAFRMKKDNFNKNHFNNMKVSTAKSIICQRTSSGLELLALTKEDHSYITTA